MTNILLAILSLAYSAPNQKPFKVHSVLSGGHYYEYGLNFLGWSPDGKYYALEHVQPDYGATACPLALKLEIVDATTDRWAKGSGYELSDSEDYRDDTVVCKYNSLVHIQAEFRRDITPLLNRLSIEIGNYTSPVELKKKESMYQFLVNGDSYHFEFTSENNNDRAWEEDSGNGYFLKWTQPTNISIEKGRRRESVFSYDVHSVLVSPKGNTAAFIIAKSSTAHEGSQIRFMSNGTTLPSPKSVETNTDSKMIETQ